MSRARHESLNAVQLFPFVAVLLCTMGSLLVLLVAVSRNSRVQAEQQVAEAKARAVEAPPVDEKVQLKLEQARQLLTQLKKQEAVAKEHLLMDQRQLSHLEDHMRRLQTELESLRTAAAEMNSLEKTHLDDREQAQRELARLGELIKDRKQAIAELKKEIGNRRAYAIIPFKSRGGTHRPPVYFECKRNSIILQPEEIRFTLNDFRGPLGSGTPITAAFRAAREHIIRQSGVANPDEAAEPYALVIIRPEGTDISKHLLSNFDKAGIAFGYELIESDAEVRFPPADPRLLAEAFQAVETARGRIASLALAAPDVYDHIGDVVDDFDPEDYEQSDTVSASNPSTPSARSGHKYATDGYPGAGRSSGSRRTSDDHDDDEDDYVAVVPTGVKSTRGSRVPSAPNGTANTAQGANGGQGTPGSVEGHVLTGSIVGFAPVSSGQRPGSSGINPGGTILAAKSNVNGVPGGSGGPAGQPGESSNASDPMSGRNKDSAPGAAAGNATSGTPALAGQPAPPGASAAAAQAGANATGSTGPIEFGNYNPHAPPAGSRLNEQSEFSGDNAYGRSGQRPVSSDAGETQIHAPDEEDLVQQRKKTRIRGKDWAIRSRTPGSVPIRRTIHVDVRGDQLTIRGEHGANDEAGAGRSIPLAGHTFEAREDISDALDKHIKAWGMAGAGLYWRPVIEVSVSDDGQSRADDLAHMLRNSGIELKYSAVAQNSEGGASSASR